MNVVKGMMIMVAGCLLLAGCATTPQRVDVSKDTTVLMGLSYADFEEAANSAVADMLEEGVADKPGGGRYVVAVGRIINKTTQNWDPDQLSKKVTIALRKSKKIVVTKMYDQNSMVQDQDENTLIKPDLELKGKVIERNLQVDKKRKQTEYYLQLELNNIKSGLSFWEGETPIIKRGSAKTVNW